jgi:hypothetical protein
MHDESDEPKPTAAEDPKDQTAEDQESPEDEVPDAAETSDDPAAQDDEATEETARWAPPEDGTPTTEQTVDPYENAPGSDSANTGPQPNEASAAPQGSGPDPQAAGPYQQDPYQQAPYQQAPYQQVPHQQGPYQSGPVPYPAPPGYPANAPKSKFASALAKGATWKTALIPPGIALLGGIIVSIILTVILTSMSEFDSLTEETGLNLDSLNYALPFILMALSLFGSAALRLDINAPDSFNAQLSIFTTGAPLVVTIVIVGLLWWMTKISERRSPAPNRVSTWIRIGVATLAMTLVLFLFQVIFAARASALEEEGSFTFSFSAVTARSFFLPLLVILITSIAGRVAGHFKGTEAIGAPFLRWAVPPLLVTWIHFALTVAVFSIVALFVLPLSVEMPGQLVPLTFVNMGLILTSLTHLGGISATAQGDLGFYSDTFSESLTLFSREAPGLLWLGLLVVAVTVLIATVVATVTRRPAWTVIEQDKQQWSSAWKLPVAFCLVWGLLSLLAIPANLSMSGSAEAAMFFGGSGAARAGIGPLAWTFLIFALWGGIIEVLSRTLGPRLALTFPAVARIAAGRTVHPHWGPYLGMSEPQFAFVHPDLAQATSSGAAAGRSRTRRSRTARARRLSGPAGVAGRVRLAGSGAGSAAGPSGKPTWQSSGRYAAGSTAASDSVRPAGLCLAAGFGRSAVVLGSAGNVRRAAVRGSGPTLRQEEGEARLSRRRRCRPPPRGRDHRRHPAQRAHVRPRGDGGEVLLGALRR